MNIAVGVEYLGTRYCGWQRQVHSPSVQIEVERALSKIADHPIAVICAGRTDTGVHGTGQVISFSTHADRPEKAWTLGGNAQLPDDISIQWARPVAEDFHARFSAVSRRYRYVICNSSHRPGVLAGQVTWVREPLDASIMHMAAQTFLGEQDFSAFQAASCQSHTSFRNVFKVSVTRQNEFVVIEITANAFLHHMVRNIAGSLIEIGKGWQPVKWIEELMSGKDRSLAAPTAKPFGLYFVKVNYPKHFQIPEPASNLWLFDK